MEPLSSDRDEKAVGSRRAVRCSVASVEQKEGTEGNEQEAAKVELGLQKFCDGILALIDKNLIPSASTVFYFKMKGDCHHYLAEVATLAAESKAGEDAHVAHAEATNVAEKDLVVTHPIRVDVAFQCLCLPV